MSTALQTFGLGCVLFSFVVFIWTVAAASAFYTVGPYRSSALEILVGSVSEELLDPRALDAFLADARKEEREEFIRRAIEASPISRRAEASDKQRQRLVELARKLRDARRDRSDTDHLDRLATAFLNDPPRVDDLKEKRARLHDETEARIRERVAATNDVNEVILQARRWIASEERGLTFAGLRDVALPTVRRMREIAAARATRGALDGLALGAAVLVVVSFVKRRPSLLSYLGTGSVLGAGVALAVTVIAFSWEVPRAEDRRLRQAGICVLFGDLGACAAALASLHSNQVTYKPVVVLVPFVVVAAVGVLLLAADSLRHRMAPTPSPNRRGESDDDPR